MFNIDEIRELIRMVEQSSIQRFELEQEATKLVIVKPASLPAVKPCAEGGDQEAAIPAAQLNMPAKTVEPSQAAGLQKILSPVVGTFYTAPEPGAEPFVKVGQKVTEDTVVCIVEVMKLFNEVEAEIKGEVAEILVKDGEFVEYGQPLFLVKPE